MNVQCNRMGCGVTYDESFPQCPECGNPTPARREEVVAVQRERRFKWNTQTAREQLLTKRQATTNTAVVAVQNLVDEFEVYAMLGAMKASTTVRLPGNIEKSFQTRDNMHSEMAALEYMLDEGLWRLYLGFVVDAESNAIKPEDFRTVEPHCGFCTVILTVLGLPLGKATRGNYNLATNCNYPLPEQVRKDPHVLARLLGGSYCAFSDVKRLLNSFVNDKRWMLQIMDGVVVDDDHYTSPEPDDLVICWDQIVKNEDVLSSLWAHIFKGIYQMNK